MISSSDGFGGNDGSGVYDIIPDAIARSAANNAAVLWMHAKLRLQFLMKKIK